LEYAQEFADELAAAIVDAPLFRHVVYAGLIPIHPSTEAHVIKWQATGATATTTMMRIFPQTHPPQIESNPFTANGFMTGGGGGALPTPQYQGMFLGGVTDGEAAYAFPFAVDDIPT
jgi:hypothetical protein